MERMTPPPPSKSFPLRSLVLLASDSPGGRWGNSRAEPPTCFFSSSYKEIGQPFSQGSPSQELEDCQFFGLWACFHLKSIQDRDWLRGTHV